MTSARGAAEAGEGLELRAQLSRFGLLPYNHALRVLSSLRACAGLPSCDRKWAGRGLWLLGGLQYAVGLRPERACLSGVPLLPGSMCLQLLARFMLFRELDVSQSTEFVRRAILHGIVRKIVRLAPRSWGKSTQSCEESASVS